MKKEHTKNSLIRFRRFCDYNINALKNNEFWGTQPKLFNDPYDSRPFYDLHFIYDNIRQYLVLSELNMYEKVSIEGFLHGYIVGYCTGFMDGRVSIIKIASLTEKSNVQNELMWAHYADSGNGFALEYEMNDLKTMAQQYYKNNVEVGISKVKYISRRFNATNDILSNLKEHVEKCKNYNPKIIVKWDKIKIYKKTNLHKRYLHKDKKWKYEKEWRFLALEKNHEQEHLKIGNIKPKAIYIGSKLKESDFKTLYDICIDKKILIYRIKPSLFDEKSFLEYDLFFDENGNRVNKDKWYCFDKINMF